MAVAPMMYSENFSPVGAGVDRGVVQSAVQDATASNQDAQARAFQEHLQKGLKGMQEVQAQLPPEVQSVVGDPAPFQATDEMRLQWYQGVNQAINKFNMAGSAAQGDQSAVDRLSLNDPKATQGQFNDVAERGKATELMANYDPKTKGNAVGRTVFANNGAPGALGPEDEIFANTAKQAEQAMTPFLPALEAEAQAAGVPLELAKALATTESRGDKNAKSLTGVKGMFQLTEDTAKELGVDRDDPLQNIKGGVQYLKKKLDKHGGDISRAMAAYNGGDDAVEKAFSKYGDSWQDHLEEFLKPIPYKKADGTKAVISPAQKAKEMREHASRTAKYNTAFGGADTLAGKSEEAASSKTTQEAALEFLKGGATPELAEKLSKLVGSSPTAFLKELTLAQRQLEEQGRNTRSGRNLEARREGLESKSDQALYDDLVKMEAPVVSQTLDDIDTILAPAGGLGGLETSLPGSDLWSRNVLPILKSKEAVNMSSLLQRLYSLELKRLSGVAVSDAEFKRYEKVFNSGGTNNPEEQMAALRAYVRAYKKQLSLAKSAYGKSWDRVAVAAGLDPDFLPSVPNAVGKNTPAKAPKVQDAGAESPANDAAAAAKKKYKLDY